MSEESVTMRGLVLMAGLLAMITCVGSGQAEPRKSRPEASSAKRGPSEKNGESSLLKRAPRARVSPPRPSVDPPARPAPSAQSGTTKPARPVRQVEKHSAEAMKSRSRHGGDHQVLDDIVVVGRAARPQVVVEIQRAKPRFRVETARYSPQAARYVKGGSQW